MSSPKILAFRGRIRNRPSALLNCTEGPYQVKHSSLTPIMAEAWKERYRKCSLATLRPRCRRPPSNDGLALGMAHRLTTGLRHDSMGGRYGGALDSYA
jgi:hypothetical protein